MRINFRVAFLSLMALTASLLATNMRPAMAQSAADDDPLYVKASLVYNYARYYAPYAIQAAAAYLPVEELNLRRGKIDQNGYGSDVNYAVQNVFGGELKPAQEAIKAWKYEFGSDSYLTCYDPSDADCQRALLKKKWDFGSGPSFQVWTRTRFPRADRAACREVSIAFRGTVSWTRDETLSNANRFYSPYDDYYYQLARNIDGIINSIKRLPCYRTATQIVSTGHSLGGGLAQLAALANKQYPRITKVFAFDPSPVTGAHVVDKQLLKANAEKLTIDRIYQEGEALYYARAAIQEYPPASSRCKPVVRTVKVDAVSAPGARGLHGMNPLAVKMVQLSYNADQPLAYLPPPSTECETDYHPPTTDKDEPLVASAGAPRTLVASTRNRRQQVNQLAEAQRSDSVTDMSPARIDSMAMMPDGHRSKKLRVASF
jgi:pimeloyl-ACP methyl ester carboxylesterase